MMKLTPIQCQIGARFLAVFQAGYGYFDGVSDMPALLLELLRVEDSLTPAKLDELLYGYSEWEVILFFGEPFCLDLIQERIPFLAEWFPNKDGSRIPDGSGISQPSQKIQ